MSVSTALFDCNVFDEKYNTGVSASEFVETSLRFFDKIFLYCTTNGQDIATINEEIIWEIMQCYCTSSLTA